MLPRWAAHLVLVAGWFLTPLWAWGGAYAGLWLGAMVGLRLEQPAAMLGAAGLGATVLGFGALWGWARFMRSLPHILARHLAPRASEDQDSSQEQAVVGAD